MSALFQGRKLLNAHNYFSVYICFNYFSQQPRYAQEGEHGRGDVPVDLVNGNESDKADQNQLSNPGGNNSNDYHNLTTADPKSLGGYGTSPCGFLTAPASTAQTVQSWPPFHTYGRLVSSPDESNDSPPGAKKPKKGCADEIAAGAAHSVARPTSPRYTLKLEGEFPPGVMDPKGGIKHLFRGPIPMVNLDPAHFHFMEMDSDNRIMLAQDQADIIGLVDNAGFTSLRDEDDTPLHGFENAPKGKEMVAFELTKRVLTTNNKMKRTRLSYIVFMALITFITSLGPATSSSTPAPNFTTPTQASTVNVSDELSALGLDMLDEVVDALYPSTSKNETEPENTSVPIQPKVELPDVSETETFRKQLLFAEDHFNVLDTKDLIFETFIKDFDPTKEASHSWNSSMILDNRTAERFVNQTSLFLSTVREFNKKLF